MIDYRYLNKVSPPCPLCGGTHFQQLACNDRYGMGVHTAGCLRCGLAQTWPRPTPTAMSTFYREHYRRYYQLATTPDASYVSRYHKNERLEYTAILIAANVNLFAGMRILDVGCAEGTLIAKLKLQCDKLVMVGVEPSEAFSAFAREATGCATYPKLEALFASGEGNFDLIVVNHVLEHVDDPVSFITRLRELLVTGGKLYVDVPDVAKYGSPQDLHIAHLFHFSQHTLAAAFEKAGYWVLSTVQHTPPHHPHSVWCVAEKRDDGSRLAHTGLEYEEVAWDKIRRAGKKTSFYLLKMRLRRNWLVSYLWEKLRLLR